MKEFFAGGAGTVWNLQTEKFFTSKSSQLNAIEEFAENAKQMVVVHLLLSVFFEFDLLRRRQSAIAFIGGGDQEIVAQKWTERLAHANNNKTICAVKFTFVSSSLDFQNSPCKRTLKAISVPVPVCAP